MLFNSSGFALFLLLIFSVYWLVGAERIKFQNFLLLVASYYFYACWDWRFLFLLIISTLINYLAALRVQSCKSGSSAKYWLWVAVLSSVGLLALFKYFNFFSTSFAEALQAVGLQVSPVVLNIVLPVGISFYTFHGLSYIIDVYKKRIEAEKGVVAYALFVSYFPLLVAGPIERATHLLPQLRQKRVFDYHKGVDGLRQILWGLFKKVVISDTCAIYANSVFSNIEGSSGSTLLLGVFFFAVQIYCDFSGYSDIAIGTSRLFGIELLRNFAFPYFSRDIAEFWRRWHISLSSWFRDYLYIPLGGSHGGQFVKIRNTFIIFLVSGFWHGANWTFIVWGLLNAIYIIPSVINGTNRAHLNCIAENSLLPDWREFFSMCLTFFLTLIAWVFFRAATLQEAFNYIAGIFSFTLFSVPDYPASIYNMVTLFLVAFLFVIEWVGRRGRFALADMDVIKSSLVRYSFYYLLVLLILLYNGPAKQFIYFQF